MLGDCDLGRRVTLVGLASAFGVVSLSKVFALERIVSNNVAFGVYEWHTDILATRFYIGEFFSEGSTAWDLRAVESFGGIDNPRRRNRYFPRDFKPNQNPFYVALPYSDLDSKARRRWDAKRLPWYDPNFDVDGYSFIMNRWIEIDYGGKRCYAQIIDCMPSDGVNGNFECDDSDYVLDNERPVRGDDVGIDVSPAVSTYLKMSGLNGGHFDAYVSWRFVHEVDVKRGPWKRVINDSHFVNWTCGDNS